MNINLQNVSLEICAGNLNQFPKNDIPQLVFSGRSNVGKSSLINTLLGRTKLARVSSAPGKTITVNFYNVDNKLYFVDLPGYGFAKRPIADKQKWSNLVDGFFTNYRRNSPMLVLQLIDLKVGPTSDDEMMIDWMNQTGVEYIVVATKSDKLNKTDYKNAMDRLSSALSDNIDVFPFSSLKGEGKKELLNRITEFVKIN